MKIIGNLKSKTKIVTAMTGKGMTVLEMKSKKVIQFSPLDLMFETIGRMLKMLSYL